ncbi:MAG TPA: DUF2842 domain-containing protein [Arsenicitalea sp.]|jgi:hypothetical protein|nr:DUF2842 domain-containing protein [Arsenicitalea sp.]
MTQSTRKLIGTVLTLVVLVAWLVAATGVYLQFLTGAPTPVLLIYFVVAGLLWCVPTAWIIRWMAKPERA